MAAWLGIATGLVEVGLRLFEEGFFFNRWLFFGPQLLWMAPAAEALVFFAAATTLLLLRRLWGGAATPRVALFAFLTLAILGVLFLYEQIHRLAALSLALGLAWQLSRILAARARPITGLVRRTWGVAVGGVLVLGLGVHGWSELNERRTLAGLPAPAAGAPNVLLLVLDTVRAPSMSLHGYPRPTTPALARFARGGVVFEHALSTSSYTPPAHHSLMTGRFPHELRLDLEQAALAGVPTLAERLAAHGYVTAGFVANMEYAGYEQGLHRGFAHYEDYPVSLPELALSSSLVHTVVNHPRVRRLAGSIQPLSRKSAAGLHGDLLDWLARRRGRPFFAFLNYYEAHMPYTPPERFARAFRSSADRVRVYWFWNRQAEWVSAHPRPSQVRAERDAYDGALAYLDEQLGELLTTLRERGLLDDTLVIVTADHGEQFGEHGLFTHNNSLYRQVLHVPLILVFPNGGVPAGLRIQDPVSTRDVAATVLDLVGLGHEARPFPGASLARHWSAGEPDPPGPLFATYSQMGPWSVCVERPPQAALVPGAPRRRDHRESLVAEGYHYIGRGDGTAEVYDFDGDPGEERDLAGSEAGRGSPARLRAAVAAMRCYRSESSNVPRPEAFLLTGVPDGWSEAAAGTLDRIGPGALFEPWE